MSSNIFSFKPRQIIHAITIALSINSLQVGASESEVIKTSASDRTGLSLTIYNQNLGLVKDTRNLNVPEKLTELEFQDVSGQINAASAMLSGVKGIRTQTFSYDLLSTQSLFKKHIGRTVVVDDHRKLPYEATILSTDGNHVLLQEASDIRILPMISEQADFTFKEIPENLRVSPTLSMNLYGTGKTGELSLTYLTGGLSWQADYVARLTNDKSMSIRGSVTLNNQSRIEYPNAHVQLLAGEVNRAQQPRSAIGHQKALLSSMSADFAMEENAKAESLGEYKLYTLPFNIDIKNNQQQQAVMFTADDVHYKKQFVATSYVGSNDKAHVGVEIHFENIEEHGLGIPLPAGVFRFYKSDDTGKDQFIGETRIGHSGKKQMIKAPIGKAFGVTAKHLNLQQKSISYTNLVELHQGWELINSEDKPVTLIIREHNLGAGSEVIFTASDVEPNKIREGVYEFEVSLQPEEKRQITYHAKVIHGR